MAKIKPLFKLAKHQVYASEMMDASPQLGIFYEAGCGKTMCILDWIYKSMKRAVINKDDPNGIDSALVICPASIVSSWESSIDKMLQFQGYTRYGVEQMKKLVTVRSFQKTYERVETRIRHRDGTVERKKVLRIRPDIHHHWGAIIIDESQGLGSHSSVQTKICLQLAEFTERRYILSGTPVSGGGGHEDYKKLYGQLKFLDPEIWKSYKEFCEELVTKFDYYGNPCAYRRQECKTLLQNYGIVARLDACYDMPDFIDIPREVELLPAKEYRDIQIGNTEPYGFDLKTGGGFFIKMLELCSGFLKDRDDEITEYPTSKLESVQDILESTDGKVVVFCNYRASIDRVKAVCEKYGKTVVYDGRSTTDTWRDFQFGDAQYLICQYQSGGVGIDLYASHTTIFYEPSLSSLLMEQAKARTRRKGQNNKCLYYWLTTKGTIEEKVVKTVREGVDVTREMLEEWAKLRNIG